MELYHHGIKGMRWGIRRYQNKDGTLTAAGKRHKEVVDGTDGKNPIEKHRQKLIQKYKDRGYA